MSTIDRYIQAQRKPRVRAVSPWVEPPTTAYHGTTKESLARHPDGLQDAYLAANIPVARYYAEATAEDRHETPVVLRVRIPDPALLTLDMPSMEEPFPGQEEDRDAAWERASAEHPEWISEGYISIPHDAWWVSWVGVGTARYGGVISPQNYEVIG